MGGPAIHHFAARLVLEWALLAESGTNRGGMSSGIRDCPECVRDCGCCRWALQIIRQIRLIGSEGVGQMFIRGLAICRHCDDQDSQRRATSEHFVQVTKPGTPCVVNPGAR